VPTILAPWRVGGRDAGGRDGTSGGRGRAGENVRRGSTKGRAGCRRSQFGPEGPPRTLERATAGTGGGGQGRGRTGGPAARSGRSAASLTEPCDVRWGADKPSVGRRPADRGFLYGDSRTVTRRYETWWVGGRRGHRARSGAGWAGRSARGPRRRRPGRGRQRARQAGGSLGRGGVSGRGAGSARSAAALPADALRTCTRP